MKQTTVMKNWKPARASLENSLKAAAYGTIFSYADLSKLAGIPDIRNERHLIESTKRCLLKHHSRVLASVRSEGYCISKPNEYAGIAKDSRDRGQNAISKAYKICRATPIDQLTEEERKVAVNEEARNGCLLVTYKILEGKELPGARDNLSVPTDSDVVRALLSKAN